MQPGQSPALRTQVGRADSTERQTHREADTLIQTETDTQRGRHTDPDRDSTEPDKRTETNTLALTQTEAKSHTEQQGVGQGIMQAARRAHHHALDHGLPTDVRLVVAHGGRL